jgi:hypothetical protein
MSKPILYLDLDDTLVNTKYALLQYFKTNYPEADLQSPPKGFGNGLLEYIMAQTKVSRIKAQLHIHQFFTTEAYLLTRWHDGVEGVVKRIVDKAFFEVFVLTHSPFPNQDALKEMLMPSFLKGRVIHVRDHLTKRAYDGFRLDDREELASPDLHVVEVEGGIGYNNSLMLLRKLENLGDKAVFNEAK